MGYNIYIETKGTLKMNNKNNKKPQFGYCYLLKNRQLKIFSFSPNEVEIISDMYHLNGIEPHHLIRCKTNFKIIKQSRDHARATYKKLLSNGFIPINEPPYSLPLDTPVG